MIIKTSLINILRGTLALGVLASLVACDTPPRRDPDYAASYPAVHASPAQSQAATGAIFQGGYDVALFEDLKAHRIGDILTIRLSESNQAAKSNNNAVSKAGSSKMDNPTILGAKPEFLLPGVLPLAAVADNWWQGDMSATYDYSCKADCMQINPLNCSIQGTLADVLHDSTLFVSGRTGLKLPPSR